MNSPHITGRPKLGVIADGWLAANYNGNLGILGVTRKSGEDTQSYGLIDCWYLSPLICRTLQGGQLHASSYWVCVARRGTFVRLPGTKRGIFSQYVADDPDRRFASRHVYRVANRWTLMQCNRRATPKLLTT